MRRKPYKTAVLGSTRGTAMKPLIEAWQTRAIRADLTCVISDRRDAPILLRAQEANIPRHAVPPAGRPKEEQEAEMIRILRQAEVEIILLIGFQRILSAEFVSHWPNRIFNIHPSLLPKHKGLLDMAVHQAVLANGETESGCTLHVVTSEVDAGPAVIQDKCPVLPEETPDSLKEKVQNLEKRVLLRFLTNPAKYLATLDTNK